MNNTIKFRIILIILIITTSSFSAYAAEDMVLADTFINALNNNIEIKEKTNEMRDLEKDLEIIRAEQAWNIGISGEYSEILNEGENDSYRSTNDNVSEGVKGVLNITKEFTSGLKINQELSYSGDNDENYYISFIQPLLPGSASSLEQEYFQKSKELLITKAELINLKENKIIEWIEDYLNILRIAETRENLKRSYFQARTHFEDLKAKASLGEAGKSELLSAEIAYLNAENEYFNIEDEFLNTKNTFILTLDIDDERNIIYDRDANLLKVLRDELLKNEVNNIDDLYKQLLNNDKELKIQHLNLTILKRNLVWNEDDSKLDLVINGSYDQSTEETIIGLNLSYDLYDGGAEKLQKKKITNDIELQKQRLANLEELKLLQLENIINNISSAERFLKINNLSFIKAEHELNIKNEQFKDGLVSEAEFLKAEVEYYISLNDYFKSRDQLFIEKLNLIKATNDQIINTERWVDNGE